MMDGMDGINPVFVLRMYWWEFCVQCDQFGVWLGECMIEWMYDWMNDWMNDWLHDACPYGGCMFGLLFKVFIF